MQSLIVLTQIKGLRKLVIHDCIINNNGFHNAKVMEKIKDNTSIEEFNFYKNTVCLFGQKELF